MWSLLKLVDLTQERPIMDREVWVSRAEIVEGTQRQCLTLIHYDRQPDNRQRMEAVDQVLVQLNRVTQTRSDLLVERKNEIDPAIQLARDAGRTDQQIVDAILGGLNSTGGR